MSESVNLKDIIKQEYILSASDPVHFIKKYCYIQHPIRGRILFNLFPFQEKLLRLLLKEDKHFIINKSRQLGISTLAAAYSLWLMLFHKDKNILCIATKQETAKNMVTKVKFMFDNLPSWLKVPTTEHNKLTLRLSNGSQIKATSAASDAGRSEAVSLLLMDEAAFIDGIDLIWAASQQTMGTGGRAIVISCVTEDTYVRTNNGIKQLKDFIDYNKHDGEGYEIDEYSVLGYKKLRKGNLLKNNGKSKTYILETGFSKPLECSPEHKLWVYDNVEKKYCWKKSQHINTDDYIALNVGGDVWGCNDSLHEFNKSIKNKKLKKEYNYNFDKVTKDIAYLIGLWIAEGSSWENKTGSGCLNISMSEHWFLEKLYNDIGIKYTLSDIKNNVNTKLSSKYLLELFKYLGFDLNSKASQKIIPTRVLEFSRENIISLLQGIFDGDGSINKKGRISLGSSSKELIYQVNLLLNNLGIISYIYSKDKNQLNSYKNPKGIKHTCDFHYLEINEGEALKFKEIIGFRLERKKERLSLIRENNRNTSDFIPNSKELVRFLIKEVCKKRLKISRESLIKNHKLYLSKILFDPNYKGNVSRKILLKLLEISKHGLTNEELNDIEKYLSPNIRWVRCLSITESYNKTYDFSLPDNGGFWDHSIIYNNILGHQTPNGVGNWFHKTFTKAEIGENNNFIPIKLPWFVHPERDQKWRDKQDIELGDPKVAAQECDADFQVIANAVFYNEWIEYLLQSTVQEPVERRGLDKSLWIWEQVDYNRDYVLLADVARGDGKDYSAFHVIDIETNTQVAEWKGQIPTREFGLFLIGIATEYNNALLVIDNASVGWDTVQTVLERGYPNLYYSPKSDNLTVEDYMIKYDNNTGLTPGFSINLRTRPLIINKFREYVGDKSVNIRSKRLIEEMKVFVWKNGRAEAQYGYNDDLVMSFSMGMYLRDTTLKYQQRSLDLTRSSMNNISKINYASSFFKTSNMNTNPYNIQTPYGDEDTSWLL